MIVIATFVAGYGLNYSFGAEANFSAWMRKNTPMSVFGISGIVIAFWLGFALSGLKALQHELRTARQKLASNDENATLLMASDPLLGELIDGTSAQNATRIRLVPEALTRLTRANLLEQKLSSSSRVILDQAPALFTGLGILFTFFGLISGLQALDLAGKSTAVTNSMAGLILGVSTAFGSSLVGIMTSLAALLATRIAMGVVETEASKLRAVIEQYDRASSPKEVFSNIRASSEQTAGAVSRGLDRIERLIDLSKKQSESLGSLSTDLSVVLQQALTAPLNNLTESIDRMSQGGVEAHAEALETMMEGFMQGFDERLGEQLKELDEVLTQTLEWHKTAHQSFADAATRLDSITSKQESVLERQRELIEAQLHIDERRHQKMEETTQALEKAGGTIENLTGALVAQDEAFEKLAGELDASIASLEAAIATIDMERKSAEQVMETIRDGAEAWREELELTEQKYQKLSETIREQLHAGLSDTFKSFDSESAKVVDRLSGSHLNMEDILGSLERSLEQMKSHSGVMVQTLSTLQKLQNQRTTSTPAGE